MRWPPSPCGRSPGRWSGARRRSTPTSGPKCDVRPGGPGPGRRWAAVTAVPALWAAQQTGATLIRIDLSPADWPAAAPRGPAWTPTPASLPGDLTAAGPPDASCEAVMRLDVLPFVPDKAAAVREVARIPDPGGRFAFSARAGQHPADFPQLFTAVREQLRHMSAAARHHHGDRARTDCAVRLTPRRSGAAMPPPPRRVRPPQPEAARS